MTFYTLRVNPDDIYDTQAIIKALKDNKHISKCVVCEEHSGRHHFHIRFYSQQSRASVFKYKYKMFPLWKSFGNERYALHDCANCKKHTNCSQKGLTYVCKEGNVLYNDGYADDELADAIAVGASLAPKKKKKDDTLADRIIKLIPLVKRCGEIVPPSGDQVLSAFVKFYGKSNKEIPKQFHYEKTLHQIAMKLVPSYRRAHHLELASLWDDGFMRDFKIHRN
jgi:hypothetical protein